MGCAAGVFYWTVMVYGLMLIYQSAFDSLSHVAIADFVLAHTPVHASWEALQLLHIICGPLFFSWKGHDGWQQPQHQGVQHGHFYSAILFASSLGSWGWLAVRKRLAPAPRQLVSSDCSPATAAVCPSPCGTKAFGSSHFGSSTFYRSRRWNMLC